MDSLVFAQLLAVGININTKAAFRLPENSQFFRATSRPAVHRGSRESTPDLDNMSMVGEDDRLELLLEDGPHLKDPTVGWQFGYSSRLSDITICPPGTGGVSRRHFAISITPEFCIQLYQQTAQATRVYYYFGGKKCVVKPQLDEKILIALEPWKTPYWDSIVINISEGPQEVVFQIRFPHHTPAASREYYESMQRCIQGQGSPASQATLAGPVVAYKKGKGTVAQPFAQCYQRQIGSGAFGIVELLVDLATGEVAARKRFIGLEQAAGKQKAAAEQSQEIKRVRNEVHLMQKHPHPHIMPVLAFQQHPYPAILMPYYSQGNMRSCPGLQPVQHVSAFRQLLLVLDYLHGRHVAHRDLKPENILIRSLDPLSIVVADFGLSRETTPDMPMTTFCGTRLYMAPDMLLNQRQQRRAQGYWASVDVWSAGVVMLEWIHGLPGTRDIVCSQVSEWVHVWSQILVSTVQRHVEADRDGRDLVMDLVQHMVTVDPTDRYSARECLQHGCASGLFAVSGSGEIVDAAYGVGGGDSVGGLAAAPDWQDPVVPQTADYGSAMWSEGLPASFQ